MKYQLVLQIPTGIPDLTYRNFGLQSSSPATGEKGIFLEKLLWNLYLFVLGCISCWSTDLESLLEVISVNSKGLIPLTCQGNSSYVEEKGIWELKTHWEHILHSFPHHTRTS